jgi:hypothetical protein
MRMKIWAKSSPIYRGFGPISRRIQIQSHFDVQFGSNMIRLGLIEKVEKLLCRYEFEMNSPWLLTLVHAASLAELQWASRWLGCMN